jgi:predicted phosphodiesterase
MKMTNRRSFMIGTAKLTGLLTAGLSLKAETGSGAKSSNLPIDIWPELKPRLCAEADKNVVKLTSGSRITFDAANGALAPDIRNVSVQTLSDKTAVIPAEGFLTFAFDVDEPLYVTGTAFVVPDGDLRPGLRFYVLSDDTVIAAPMVAAPAWVGVDKPGTGPAPDCRGTKPPDTVPLVKWFLAKGRHYITVAGPHFRPGGTFERLEIIALNDKVESPQYQFALVADSHLSLGKRFKYTNVIMAEPSIARELAATFKSLRKEGVDFTMFAGDMTNNATRDQFQQLADVLNESKMPCYGCVGNHDSYHKTSRPDQLELLPGMFPGMATDYILYKRPLRFIVLDGSFWKHKDGKYHDFYDKKQSAGIGMKPEQIEWLQWALTSDVTTPTVIVSHYVFKNNNDVSSAGFNLAKISSASVGSKVMELLGTAPNVVATLNGHTHWNELALHGDIQCIQNAAFAEWPCMYRVFRVYADRVEWEVRQVGNRGLICDACQPEKALNWMISTHEGDLAGEFRFRAENK